MTDLTPSDRPIEAQALIEEARAARTREKQAEKVATHTRAALCPLKPRT
jgi:hypothetical protein